MKRLFHKNFLPSSLNYPKVLTLDHLLRLKSTRKELENLPKEFVYPKPVEDQINKQIHNELQVSYSYLDLSNFFARTDIALPGASNLFQTIANDELGHATKLMGYQCLRGGKVALRGLEDPTVKNCKNLLQALEFSLEREKWNSNNLKALIDIAETEGDTVTGDWVMENLMREQVTEIRRLGTMITKLKLLEGGIGIHFIDKLLLKQFRYRGNNAIYGIKSKYFPI